MTELNAVRKHQMIGRELEISKDHEVLVLVLSCWFNVNSGM